MFFFTQYTTLLQRPGHKPHPPKLLDRASKKVLNFKPVFSSIIKSFKKIYTNIWLSFYISKKNLIPFFYLHLTL